MNDIEKNLNTRTLEKLAERLHEKNVTQKVKCAAREFFAGKYDGAMDGVTAYMMADVFPVPEVEEIYSKMNDAYIDGYRRGILAGMAAMEEFFLFLDEPNTGTEDIKK